jgi:arsenical pump membrane protein
VVLVIALPDPAPWVLAVGVASVAWRVAGRRFGWREAVGVLGVPVLVGLFGAAVALGALGRAWSGAAQTLNHLGPWATAGAGGAASVLVNNLPAAALLSARPPAQPLALLIGLDVGPNLFFTGSLAWVLWYRSGRAAGGRPRVRRTVLLGLVSAPLAGAAAVAALVATGAAR